MIKRIVQWFPLYFFFFFCRVISLDRTSIEPPNGITKFYITTIEPWLKGASICARSSFWEKISNDKIFVPWWVSSEDRKISFLDLKWVTFFPALIRMLKRWQAAFWEQLPGVTLSVHVSVLLVFWSPEKSGHQLVSCLHLSKSECTDCTQ